MKWLIYLEVDGWLASVMSTFYYVLFYNFTTTSYICDAAYDFMVHNSVASLFLADLFFYLFLAEIGKK